PSSLIQLPSGSGGAILLQWPAPSDEGGTALVGYNVFRDGVFHEEIPLTDALVQYRDMLNVAANRSYTYVVYAVNTALTGRPSPSLVARSTNATVAALANVTIVEVRGGAVDIAWHPSPDSGGLPITAFKVTLTRGSVTVATYTGLETERTFRGLFASTPY